MKNLPYLFTYREQIGLNIPNTTNGIVGVFADLKNKLRNHNGLTKTRKMKLIDAYLQICGENRKWVLLAILSQSDKN